MIPVVLQRQTHYRRKQRHFKCFHCQKEVYPIRNTTNKRFCLDCEAKAVNARAAAHAFLRTSIEWGVLKDPHTLTCKDCGAAAYCYDLRNYSEPWKAEPVCRRCNNLRGPAILGDHYG